MARAVRVADGRRPGPIAVLTLLVLTRVQGVALVPAFVAAVRHVRDPARRAARRSYLLRFAPTAIVLGLGLLGVATIVAGRERGGARQGTREAGGHLVLADVPRQFDLQLGGLLVMVAVVPFVASVRDDRRRPVSSRSASVTGSMRRSPGRCSRERLVSSRSSVPRSCSTASKGSMSGTSSTSCPAVPRPRGMVRGESRARPAWRCSSWRRRSCRRAAPSTSSVSTRRSMRLRSRRGSRSLPAASSGSCSSASALLRWVSSGSG